MNASNHNYDPASSDDPSDRLIDVVLSELVGGQAPPDLSSRITAAFVQAGPISPASKYRRSRAVWISLAVAGMLLIGTPILFLSTIQHHREGARQVSQLQSLDELTPVSPQATSAPDHPDRLKVARPIVAAKQSRLGHSAAAPKKLGEVAKSDLSDLPQSPAASDGGANVQDTLAQEFGPPPIEPAARTNEFRGGP